MPHVRTPSLKSSWNRTAARELVTEALEQRLRILAGTVVDVGGGRDAPHDRAWPPSARRIRVDVSPVHRPDVIADALRLPFGSSSVDGVVLVETLEHLPAPWTAIEEIYRVLRPGGVVIGTAPFSFPIHGDPHDYFRFTADGLRSLFRDFASVDITPHGGSLAAAWSIVSGRWRWLRAANPLVRRIGRTPDGNAPLGHVFVVRR